ncbi:MAG: MoaD/ThiS family protein [Gammaproteobacteria bacterium]|nr:MoaD/ThiS family protein [Gammaproteobacteria bacterium]
MKITLKLYATLSDLLPPGAARNAAQIEVPDGASLNWVIREYRVPQEMAHLVLLNGLFHCDSERDEIILSEGDTLAIWPPVAGG